MTNGFSNWVDHSHLDQEGKITKSVWCSSDLIDQWHPETRSDHSGIGSEVAWPGLTPFGKWFQETVVPSQHLQVWAGTTPKVSRGISLCRALLEKLSNCSVLCWMGWGQLSVELRVRWGRVDQKNTVYEIVCRSLSSSMMADGQISREGQAGDGI